MPSETAAYYHCLSREIGHDGCTIAHYRPTQHAQGAWRDNEQHMAPASGILAFELERFQPRPEMHYARISYDILGVIPLQDFTIETRLIRPGKTIELVEASLRCQDKTAIVARAWRLITEDTRSIAGLEDEPLTPRHAMAPWEEMIDRWPGGFIQSLRQHVYADRRPGRGQLWLSTPFEMVAGEVTSPLVKLLGLVDINNGLVIRQSLPLSHSFPNVDLQVHLYRQPVGQWLGVAVTQQYGESGIGLTSAVLHDEHGPFGHSEQILTVRRLAP